jgi:hypothetical protein
MSPEESKDISEKYFPIKSSWRAIEQNKVGLRA